MKKLKIERGLWRIRFNTAHGSFRYVFWVSRSERIIVQKSIVLRKDAY
ncbi:MAG: hypothetical protein ACUVV0_09785 [Anaerolineae bacterium]